MRTPQSHRQTDKGLIIKKLIANRRIVTEQSKLAKNLRVVVNENKIPPSFVLCRREAKILLSNIGTELKYSRVDVHCLFEGSFSLAGLRI